MTKNLQIAQNMQTFLFYTVLQLEWLYDIYCALQILFFYFFFLTCARQTIPTDLPLISSM